jgi:hypothetical protein
MWSFQISYYRRYKYPTPEQDINRSVDKVDHLEAGSQGTSHSMYENFSGICLTDWQPWWFSWNNINEIYFTECLIQLWIVAAMKISCCSLTSTVDCLVPLFSQTGYELPEKSNTRREMLLKTHFMFQQRLNFTSDLIETLWEISSKELNWICRSSSLMQTSLFVNYKSLQEARQISKKQNNCS